MAKHYYRENRDKFTFFSYTIIDMDKEIEEMRQLGWMQDIDMDEVLQMLAESN